MSLDIESVTTITTHSVQLVKPTIIIYTVPFDTIKTVCEKYRTKHESIFDYIFEGFNIYCLNIFLTGISLTKKYEFIIDELATSDELKERYYKFVGFVPRQYKVADIMNQTIKLNEEQYEKLKRFAKDLSYDEPEENSGKARDKYCDIF